MVFIGVKMESIIEVCEDEIVRRENWLNTGDYTDRELPAIKRDIKRFRSIKKRLENAFTTYKELETY